MSYLSEIRRYLSNNDLLLKKNVSATNNFYPIEKSEFLIDEQTDVIKRIDAFIGLSSETFCEYHLSVISNFARLVQRIPAYNSNHFLINKTLNQYLELLKNTKVQSINSINLSNHIFNFSVLIAMLSHVASQEFSQIDVYYKDRNGNVNLWHPLDGFIDLCREYRYQEKDQNKRTDENALNRILFFNLLLTKSGHTWLVLDNLITTQMRLFLSDNHCDNTFDRLIAQLNTEKDSNIQLNVEHREYKQSLQEEKSNLVDSQVLVSNEKNVNRPRTIENTPRSKKQTSKQEHLLSRPSLRFEIIEEYKRWLNASLEDGSIRINRSHGRLHIVNEGLLLITPGIFQDYEKVSMVSWRKLQSAILKSGWHIRDSKKHNFLTYYFKGARKESILKGIVIKDPAQLLTIQPPLPNLKIQKIKES